MKSFRGIGLMSGTSLDGVDAVLVRFQVQGETIDFTVEDQLDTPYPQALRQALLELSDPERGRIDRLTSMQMYLGRFFADVVQNLLKKAGVAPEEVAFVSTHGQTICHMPLADPEDPHGVPGTLQIGDLSVLAYKTKITAVGDFRTADMAAGGLGAPLVSFFDAHVLGHRDKARAVQNIGGIGNVTYLPPQSSPESLFSFDTGPGNMVIDAVISALTEGKEIFDRGGAMGFSGKVDEAFLEGLMRDAYLAQAPPKTTGREHYGAAFVRDLLLRAKETDMRPEDLVATVTDWTAATIADAYRRWIMGRNLPLDEVIVGGGGSANRFLMERLQERLPKITVGTHEAHGIDSHMKEALAFAYLGCHTLLGRINQLPEATGAREPVIMGKVAWADGQAFDRWRRAFDGDLAKR